MAEKTFNTRIIHKHDTAEHWGSATNFIPKQGEIVVYDIDENYSYERFKIGDGITNVNNLPFNGEWNENVQSDWNENDETNDAYVKNRTHYKSYEVTTFIDDEAFPFEYFGMGFGTLPVELEFKVGETYTVIWEGTTYECICKEDDAKYVGNFSILKYTAENTGEPFLITPLAVTTKAQGTSHSIKATGPLAVYHKIDEKYLPDSVVKSVNNILPDENGNVELEIATDDDILALMMEVDALPVVMDESGAIMTDEEGAILLA